MTVYTPSRIFSLTILALFLVLNVRTGEGSSVKNGLKPSDPRLVGARDMNYDHLIIPGDRIGPVALNGLVTDAVQHLGNPDKVWRSTFRGPGYSADEVYYWYKDECIVFTWQDSGLNPRIENGLRGINAFCNKWSTRGGIHVGDNMKDVNAQVGQYCPSNRPDGSLIIATKEGVWFESKNRYSPITIIRVMPSTTTWNGMCTD